ncbi:PilW family protein [Massilia sp. W12]|uniref:PilW family protein n=1 Tax=Massilia sp. W12 TaxID=3126507 RepID=UPI0030D34785
MRLQLAHHKTAGFSLIELMISLTIGMLIVLFVVSLYLGGRSSNRQQDDNSRMQEDGRTAMFLIGKSIKQAWYGQPTSYFIGGLRTDLQAPGLMGCDGGFSTPSNLGNATCANAANAPAALQLSYRVDNTPNPTLGIGTDCNNQQAAADARGNLFVVNRFYLAKSNNADPFPSLMCAGNGNPTPQPVMQNVEDMVFTYGINTTPNDDDRTADMYTDSVAVALQRSPASPGFPETGYPPLKDVVSVGVCLQIVSPNLTNPTKQTLVDCRGRSRTFEDKRMRLILRNVFAVRNNSGTSLLAARPAPAP